MVILPPAATCPAPRGAAWPTWLSLVVASFLLVAGLAWPAAASGRRARLSADLAAHLARGDAGPVDVIVSARSEVLARLARGPGVTVRKTLQAGAVLTVTPEALESIAADPAIAAVSSDAVVRSHMAVTTAATGAELAWAGLIGELGPMTGEGVGVAVIDSGIMPVPALAGRIVASVDFTSRRGYGLDRYGHGTHVAGIIAAGRRRGRGAAEAPVGMAPGVHIISLKVLGSDGSGRVSAVVEAIDWAIANRRRFRIRVLNLSLGAPPTQSWRDDPLCQAVERAVRAGLVVVASAGNYGITEDGRTVLGSVTSPGISPYAITVGALRTQGTVDRWDDEVAPWSSRGPTYVDHLVKPDLVAPGSQIVSLAAPGSALVRDYPERRVGAHGLSLSGTSMAAAVVSGAVALLLDAEPGLAPLQVKLALQASAEFLPAAGLIAGGAGSLSLEGIRAVSASVRGTPYASDLAYALPVPLGNTHSDVIVWGELVVLGEVIEPGDASPWDLDATVIVWGESARDVIVWGDALHSSVVGWGEASDALRSSVIVWGE